MNEELLERDVYVARRSLLSLWSPTFRVYDGRGRLIGRSRQKAFRLKEDIRVHAADGDAEILRIQARHIVDFSAAFDVIDPAADRKVGVLRRRGFKSIVRDCWEILDADDHSIGQVIEDRAWVAAARRFLGWLVPQNYRVMVRDECAGTIRQRFNPFVLKLEADFSPDVDRTFPRPLGLAAVILLLAIEGRQRYE